MQYRIVLCRGVQNKPAALCRTVGLNDGVLTCRENRSRGGKYGVSEARVKVYHHQQTSSSVSLTHARHGLPWYE